MPVTTRSMKKMSAPAPTPAPRPYLVITAMIIRSAPTPRRSTRLAAKPPVSYREVDEDEDEDHEPSVTVIEDGDRPVYREYQDDVCRWCGRVHAPYVPPPTAPPAPARTIRDTIPEADRPQFDTEVTTIKNMLNNVEDAVGAENKTVQSIALFEFLLTNNLIVAASPKFRNTVLSKIVELEEQVKVKSVSPYRVDCFHTVVKHVRLMIDGISSHPHYRA